ncbi:MAG: alpha-ribazole phosphatase [Ekhidna sp.]|nr:alpha-ribazole phosphatase [Ekhidna sp.]
MEIYLIRHTTPNVAKGICYGQADLDVTENFEQEAQLLMELLPHSFDIVFSSTLRRCARLAYFISADVNLDERLMEVSFGDWELKKWDEIDQKQLSDWMKDFVFAKPPGGESATELYDRVVDFYQELKSSDFQKVVIVTHMGVIRMFYSFLKKVSIEEAFQKCSLNYGEILKIE